MQDPSQPADGESRPPQTLNELIARLDDDATGPIVLVDEQGTMLFVSTTFVRVTGYPHHESVGRWLVERVHPDDRAQVRRCLAAPTEAAGEGNEGRYRLKGGAWRRFVFSASWCTTTEGPIAIVRLRAIATTETAERPIDAPMQRCNAHQTILRLEPILRRLAGGNIEVVYRLEATAVHVALTAFQLEQIMVHLASNARDAMPAGGVLTISTRNLLMGTADAAKPNCHLELVVTDTGMGLSPRLSLQIFEPYFTTKAERGNSGLGLTIVQRFVDAGSGQVDVQSSLGKGAQFRLLLPIVGAVSGAGEASDPPCPQNR